MYIYKKLSNYGDYERLIEFWYPIEITFPLT